MNPTLRFVSHIPCSKKVAALVAALWMAVSLVGQTSDSTMLVNAVWQTDTIANGVVFKQTALKDYFSSNQYISCIEVAPNSAAKLAFAYNKDLDYTSQMAKKQGAIAAINGSFFDMQYFNPICYLRIDGENVGENTNKNTPYRKYYQYGTFVLDDNGMPKILKTDSLRVWENSLPYQNIMTAGPLLIQSGKEQPMRDDRTFVTHRHNRTAIGIKPDGTVLMIAVDGRHAKAQGMTLVQLIKTLKWLGCVDALNMDGGGSTTCYIKGRGVVNYPSDNNAFDHKGERKVSNAILLMVYF